MSYFGKEFKFESEENYEEFIKALGLTGEIAENFKNYRPTIKLVKNGDSYTLSLTSPGRNKELSFTSGASFNETVGSGLEATTTITVDGNTFTQVQKFADRGSLTTKREFTDDKLTVTLTAETWPGESARRFYVAA